MDAFGRWQLWVTIAQLPTLTVAAEAFQGDDFSNNLFSDLGELHYYCRLNSGPLGGGNSLVCSSNI